MDIFVLVTAVILDLIIGEPPSKIHPTTWFGKVIGFLDQKWRRRNPKADILAGSLSLILVLIFALLLASTPTLLFFPLNYIIASYLLFSSFSIRSMVEHARACVNDKILPEKVQLIVSRDTSKLNQPQLSSAVIESLAENFVDGVLAPLLYFSVFGIHGAVVYRAINVCDAMIGYRDARYEYFGKAAAKLDDILNFIPARFSVLLFSIFKPECFLVYRQKVKLNGHAIVAMAKILEVRLEKPSSYVINAGKEPEAADIERGIAVYWKLCILTILCAAILMAS
jgi:adenosylcobinamide-phosphate synthase